MLQVRKSRFCGIAVIFFQCCFLSETQVLMTVSDFGFFSRNPFLKRGFIFQREVLHFQAEVAPHGDISFDGRGGFVGVPPMPPTMGNPDCTGM